MKAVGRYIWAIGVALSILLNAVTGGEAFETMSYRSAKARRDGRRWGCLLCQFLDTIHRDHCERTLKAWEGENEQA